MRGNCNCFVSRVRKPIQSDYKKQRAVVFLLLCASIKRDALRRAPRNAHPSRVNCQSDRSKRRALNRKITVLFILPDAADWSRLLDAGVELDSIGFLLACRWQGADCCLFISRFNFRTRVSASRNTTFKYDAALSVSSRARRRSVYLFRSISFSFALRRILTRHDRCAQLLV